MIYRSRRECWSLATSVCTPSTCPLPCMGTYGAHLYNPNTLIVICVTVHILCSHPFSSETDKT